MAQLFRPCSLRGERPGAGFGVVTSPAGGDVNPPTCPRCGSSATVVCIRGVWRCGTCFVASWCLDLALQFWRVQEEAERITREAV